MLQVGEFAPPFQLSPVFGLPIRSEGRTRPLVLVFMRGLRQRALAPLQELWPELDRQGIGLVLLTDVPLATARDRIPRYLLRFPVVLDPSQTPGGRLGGLLARPRMRVLAPDQQVLVEEDFDPVRLRAALGI